LDVHAVGLTGLAHFGFGFLEVGPVTVEPIQTTAPIERRVEHLSIKYSDLPINDGLAIMSKKLARISPLPLPLGIRLAWKPGASASEAADKCACLIAQLSQFADFFTLDSCSDVASGLWSLTEWRDHLASVMQTIQRAPRPLLLCLSADIDLQVVHEMLALARELGVHGVIVSDGVKEVPAGHVVGGAAREPCLCMVRTIHTQWGDQLPIIGSCNVNEPYDALQLLEAGATLVQVHSGLVYSGPGLPKRINEAVAYFTTKHSKPSMTPTQTSPGKLLRQSWIWMILLGVSMIVGSILVGIVAVTRVILPYDEAFVGITRDQLGAINNRLLPFMTHDRVTLAGTMLSLGILYTQLALHGIRSGVHWAWLAMVVSCLVGFASFFLFLGFGYFDPLHAVVAVILFLFFLAGLRRPASEARGNVVPNLHNDREWMLSLWGQFFFVVVAVGLTVAGLVIATIGVTHVFVPEDLQFLQTTPALLHLVNPRLIPLIAHDRAGFGGALVSDGVAILLIALWGFRQGARWVWWTLAGAGGTEFLATLLIHWDVGYTNLWHLAPTLVAAVPYTWGLILSYPYLSKSRTAASGQVNG
jgi:dihydroorotate dehydrogenase